jgi:hypothetical protein
VQLRRARLACELEIQASRVDEHRVQRRVAVACAERREIDGVVLRSGREVETHQVARTAPRDVRGTRVDHRDIARFARRTECEGLLEHPALRIDHGENARRAAQVVDASERSAHETVGADRERGRRERIRRRGVERRDASLDRRGVPRDDDAVPGRGRGRAGRGHQKQRERDDAERIAHAPRVCGPRR